MKEHDSDVIAQAPRLIRLIFLCMLCWPFGPSKTRQNVEGPINILLKPKGAICYIVNI